MHNAANNNVKTMEKISVNFTETEHKALVEFARMCEEKPGELVRKIVMQEITFMKGSTVGRSKKYEYDMSIPSGMSLMEEELFVEENYNRIRKIVGLEPIKIWY